MQGTRLTKETFSKIIRQLNAPTDFSIDFIYDVYLLSMNAIEGIYKSNILQQPYSNINHAEIAFYCLGEYGYSVVARNQEEKEKFDNNEDIKISMASVVADKFLSLSHFTFKERKIANKFLPTMSSLSLYLNFMLNILNSYHKNDPKSTLLVDLLIKSVSLSRCVLNLLMDGNETEAFATWRTLHECECTLILLDKYGDQIIDSYLRHMKYGLAYKNLISSKEEQDNIFVEIKQTMKEHDLKSKDMKKFIEYGWLYDVPNFKEIENFKLNFRDGLQKMAGLEAYNRRYEISSEIIHSTPMLFYAVKENYYFMSLLSLYESFFRLENVFLSIYSKRVSLEALDQYNKFRRVYYMQLINIHKREVASFNSWQQSIKKK